MVVALGSAGAGRVALLAAGRVHHPVAATPTHLGGARRGAAVAAERVAIVALLARVDDPVATARRRAVAVAVAGRAVERTVVALLARVDDAVATVGDALALGVAPRGDGRVALFAAHRVHDPVAAAEPGLERAGGRAAVAAHRVAVVALLGAARDAVAAAGDERAGVAAAVAVVRVAVVALLARLDDAVATDGGLRRQLDLDELAAPLPLLHVRLVGLAGPRVAVGIEDDLAHEAAARRHRVGAEALARRVEADERVGRRAGDPHVARLPVRIEGVRLLRVAVARRSGRPGREVVDLPALDRGIEAAEDTRAVSRYPDDAVGPDAEAARPVEGRLPGGISPVVGSSRPIRCPKSCDHQIVPSGATSHPYGTGIESPTSAGSAGGRRW